MGSLLNVTFVRLVLLLGTLCLSQGLKHNNRNVTSARQGKLFSLFNIVSFDNGPCQSSSSVGSGTNGNRNGTCYTANECIQRGGSSSGNCAAGFGVCCVFYLSSGGTTAQNCTYLRNDNFPSGLSTTNGQSFTINKCSCDVCYLRLDFLTFSIQGMALTDEIMGSACVDSLKVTSSSNEPIPEICGQNSGQHIYVDMDRGCSGNAKLDFSFTGEASTRIFEIKATQIECGSRSTPPDGCLQYHTNLDGRFTTFNYAPMDNLHLEDQDYSICIRQELGYCCVQYSVCPDDEALGFSLSKGVIADNAYTDSECATLDFVGIEGSSSACRQSGVPSTVFSRYCGQKLNDYTTAALHTPICDCSPPFQVRIFTNKISDIEDDETNTKISRGVCFEYTQIPCN
ncbi:uncharacterized protein LOC131879537 [Tigriopus californicus]|uniref:uncharacterized protein LOC131879537 n=1 Tax=Tigriopus californicus TaxID=6832 RepID=UPI0027DA45EC|nr:uncharacterized protein LOC131879537 [Tigriopus californicus]